jgi:hypothetical protein
MILPESQVVMDSVGPNNWINTWEMHKALSVCGGCAQLKHSGEHSVDELLEIATTED